MHNCWFEQILIHIFQTLNIEKQWNCITTSDHHIEQLHYKKNHIKGQKIALIETEKQPRLCNTCRNTMRSMWDTHYALAVLLFPSLYTTQPVMYVRTADGASSGRVRGTVLLPSPKPATSGFIRYYFSLLFHRTSRPNTAARRILTLMPHFSRDYSGGKIVYCWDLCQQSERQGRDVKGLEGILGSRCQI